MYESDGNIMLSQQQERFVCKHCCKSYARKSNLTRHIVKHYDGDLLVFHCEVCQYSAFRRDVYEAHMQTHSDENYYKCDKCELKFAKRSNLTRHSIIHTGEKSFKCQLCRKYLQSKNNLQQHRIAVHLKLTSKTFKCKDCNRMFS